MVAVLTKFDALDAKAFIELEDVDGAYKLSWDDAQIEAPHHAVMTFGPQLKLLYEHKFPPKCHVLLRGVYFVFLWLYLMTGSDMNKDGAHCRELTERTASVIDNNTLKLLFVSTQLFLNGHTWQLTT